MKTSAPVMATISGISGHYKIGQIVGLKTGSALSFDQFIDQIKLKELIFIGEVHDNPDHHLIQVQILQSLVDCCGPVTTAMEFFQKHQQPFLDRYLQGELTEAEFLKAVDWSHGWGFDYHFYRPLMLIAKQNGYRILAINAPRDVVRKVARHGLKGLDTSERNELAKDIDLNNEAHRAYLREAYEQHAHKDLANFEYFYEAQCAWEDTMAQGLAEYLREKKTKLIVFSGNGHIINKFGIPDRTIRRFSASMVTIVIPDRTIRRFSASMVTIVPYPISEEVTITKETADYVWLTRGYPHRHRSAHGWQ
jgi:uncharacterized iron-regulated protein